MSFNRPSLFALIAAAEADYESRLIGADARLPAANINVSARVLAGGLHGLHGHLAFIANQVLPDSAEAEYLDRHAGLWGLSRQPGALATGQVVFTGNSGAPILAATALQRTDGITYVTTADAVIASGTATVSVLATEAGTASNLATGAKLKMVASLAGIDITASVASGGLTSGAEIESDATLLDRLLSRIRLPPHGGAGHDYRNWALEVAGVTRAWVLPKWMGDGTVGLTFVCDDDPGGVIPSPTKVADVQAYIEADHRKHVTAELFVFAPTAVVLDLTIAGLDPSTPAIKAAVEAEIRDLLRREAAPGATILLSHLREAISTALGERDHQLTHPTASVTHAAHEMAVMGTITWI